MILKYKFKSESSLLKSIKMDIEKKEEDQKDNQEYVANMLGDYGDSKMNNERCNTKNQTTNLYDALDTFDSKPDNNIQSSFSGACCASTSASASSSSSKFSDILKQRREQNLNSNTRCKVVIKVIHKNILKKLKN
jgi:hypothetical protein